MRTAPQTIELDGPRLKAEAEKSHEFLTLVYYGANRQRNSEVTDIEQMRKLIEVKHGENLDSGKWLEAFKRLEDLGMGSLILGRRGKPNRFRWNYSLKAIGTAAMNGLTLTAHRIIPKMKGDKVVNDYDRARPITPPPASLAEADDEEEEVARPPARKPPGLVKREAPRAQAPTPRNMLFVPLRPDYAFEAEMPNLTEQEADFICSAIRRCVK